MAKTPSKKPKVREDANTTAFRTLQEALGEAERTPDPDAGKDPAAMKRGRAGGIVGGVARAGKLPASKRKEIAQKAAKKRWAAAKSHHS
jgi:hypothetical protein